jgi:Zn-dependent protease with chaperone function
MTQSIQARSLNVLWEAQKEGLKASYNSIFPVVTNDYIKSCHVVPGTFCRVYKTLYDSVAAIHYGAAKVVQATSFVFGKIDQGLNNILPYRFLKQRVFVVYNYVLPVNPINGERQFNLFSRNAEKFLGDNIFYPINSYRLLESSEISLTSGKNYSSITADVTEKLNASVNSEILNPNGQTAFNYRTKLVRSNQINAFACPGGGMVVYDGLIKELEREFVLKNQGYKAITSSTVTLLDGSQETIDLSDVTLEDVTAALIGHEMTHAASRHSMVAITADLITKVLYSAFKYLAIGYMKANDQEYQSLLKDSKAALTSFNSENLKKKEEFYLKMHESSDWVFSIGLNLLSLFRSRQNEFEADITGMYLAANAGFNPKGAIYLQEILEKEAGRDWYPDFFLTHPISARRKQALLAAYATLNKQPKATNSRSA